MVPMAPSRTCTRPSSIKSRSVGILPFVVQVGRQPALDGGNIHRLAAGVILDLVALDFSHAEVLGLWVPEVVSADRRRWQHGKAFCKRDSSLLLRAQEVEEGTLLGVVRTRGIPRGRPNALKALLDEPLSVQVLIPGVTPELRPNSPVKHLSKRFGQPVGQSLGEDRFIVVVFALKPLHQGLYSHSRRHRESTHIVAD